MNLKERIQKAIETKAANDEEERRIQEEKDRLYQEQLKQDAPNLVEKIMQQIEFMILDHNLDDHLVWEAKNDDGFNEYVKEILVNEDLKVEQLDDRRAGHLTTYKRWRISWAHWD